MVKSKYEVAGEHTASKTDDGDTVKPDKANEADMIKEKIKGAAVYKKGSTNQYFWEVWRRYSEFDLLRNFLQTVYPYVSLCVIALLECLCMVLQYTIMKLKYVWDKQDFTNCYFKLLTRSFPQGKQSTLRVFKFMSPSKESTVQVFM